MELNPVAGGVHNGSGVMMIDKSRTRVIRNPGGWLAYSAVCTSNNRYQKGPPPHTHHSTPVASYYRSAFLVSQTWL
jgi:hypothetical protein